MPRDWDVIVVGSGAGGGTLAQACARLGKNVLLIERGRRFVADGDVHDEEASLIAKRPYDDRTVAINGQPRRPYVGGIYGGGTSLYGAALLRPSQADFHPGQSYGHRIPRAIWDWPIDYDALEPYYTEAEGLFGVAGDAGDDFDPLPKPGSGFSAEAIALRPINRRLVARNRERGLRPFRLPLAIDFRTCLRCPACPGYFCPNGARRSAAQLVDRAVADGAPLQVMTGVEVESLERNGRGIDGVRVVDRTTGRRDLLRAGRYVLAAGALQSPALLLRSGIAGPLVGRHYMYHLSPIVAGLFARPTGGDAGFIKQVGFADYYFGTKAYPHKMGIIQSLPVPGPKMIAKAIPRRLPAALVGALRRRMLPLVGIVEDLPDPGNRVVLGSDGAAEIQHRFGSFDLIRGARLGRLMSKILKAAGAFHCVSVAMPSEEHVAHQCGTLRFGRNEADAVLDPDCRVFGLPNLFVVDGSFLPTSLGVGPALTIAANALRVARVVASEA